MSSLGELAARKKQLLARAQHERASIARVYYEWQARKRVARQVAGILKNPLVLSALGMLAWKMPWRKAWRLSGWTWRGWKLLRIIRRMLT